MPRPEYWVEIKGRLYARLPCRGDDDKRQIKYQPISDKRAAKRAVEETLHCGHLSFIGKLCALQSLCAPRVQELAPCGSCRIAALSLAN